MCVAAFYRVARQCRSIGVGLELVESHHLLIVRLVGISNELYSVHERAASGVFCCA